MNSASASTHTLNVTVALGSFMFLGSVYGIACLEMTVPSAAVTVDCRMSVVPLITGTVNICLTPAPAAMLTFW